MSQNAYPHYRQYAKYDPYHARECEKYQNPLPSREYILDCLETVSAPLSLEDLLDIFQIADPGAKRGFCNRLIAMQRQGQIMKNRRKQYASVQKLDLIRGRICAHRSGYGFFIPDDGSCDIFIPSLKMQSLFEGDIVLVRASKAVNGKRAGVVVEILEHTVQQIAGHYFEAGKETFVRPYHKHITQDILIPREDRAQAKDGQYVICQITAYPTARRQPMGQVIEILGDHLSAGMETEIVMRTYEISDKWSDAVCSEVAHYTACVPECHKQDRKDIRDLPLLTIDGDDAKDFDDALYCHLQSDGCFRLVVAIADVAHYVKVGSATDQEAYLRGTSVYFPNRTISMLPPILSDELCSLKPHVDRLCMVCDMQISAQGKVQNYVFYDAVMRSRARLTYEQVTGLLMCDEINQSEYRAVLESLRRLYHQLRAERELRGALDFDTTQTCIIFDAYQKISTIVLEKRTIAHRMVEESMLITNAAAADFLIKQKMPTLYRVHDGIASDSLGNLESLIKNMGLQLTWGKRVPSPKQCQELLQKAQGRPDSQLLQMAVLGALKRAVYSEENTGHFGLAYAAYLHFTSPIRRYPDLMVQRGIRACLSGQPFSHDHDFIATCAKHCSSRECRADEATREVNNWLKCYYMQDRIGQIFEGIIVRVTGFGVFVALKEIHVEGLLHITALRDDYYQYDAVHHLLKGRRTGTVYKLGDTLSVMVAKADMDERTLDFALPKNGA